MISAREGKDGLAVPAASKPARIQAGTIAPFGPGVDRIGHGKRVRRPGVRFYDKVARPWRVTGSPKARVPRCCFAGSHFSHVIRPPADRLSAPSRRSSTSASKCRAAAKQVSWTAAAAGAPPAAHASASSALAPLTRAKMPAALVDRWWDPAAMQIPRYGTADTYSPVHQHHDQRPARAVKKDVAVAPEQPVWEPSFECAACERAWALLRNGVDPKTVYVDSWCKEHVPRCVRNPSSPHDYTFIYASATRTHARPTQSNNRPSN